MINFSHMKKLIIIIVIAIIVITGAIAIFTINNQKTVEPVTSDVVATVNGVDISRVEFEKELNAAKATITAQGQGGQLTDPAIMAQLEAQVLDQLINTQLIFGEIEKAGIVVSDEDIANQYNLIVENVGGQEAFVAELAKASISDVAFKENIKKQMLTQKYLTTVISEEDVAVTDEEVEAFYNQSIEGQENVPALEEVSDQLRTQLSQQKGDQLVSALIDQLRASAQIETFLPAPAVAENAPATDTEVVE